jgi:hypothetical protein
MLVLRRCGGWVVRDSKTRAIVHNPPDKGSRQACRKWIKENKDKQCEFPRVV